MNIVQTKLAVYDHIPKEIFTSGFYGQISWHNTSLACQRRDSARYLELKGWSILVQEVRSFSNIQNVRNVKCPPHEGNLPCHVLCTYNRLRITQSGVLECRSRVLVARKKMEKIRLGY